MLIDEVHDEPAQLGWVLDFVLRLAKNDAEHARPLAEFLQRMAVMNLEIVAIQLQQTRPIETIRDCGRHPAQARLLVRHLQEQQKRQLLDVIPVGQTVIP